MQGLILINKPKDITSFGVVAKVRRLCGVKRVGHTGTLDPMATGVLPIFIGRPTVLSNYLINADKEYKAKIKLGIVTDTLDITGNVLKSKKVNVSREDFEAVLRSMLGKSMQVPPMYSAIKKDGVRLYDIARNGGTVERTPREINIFETELISFSGDSAEIRVLCSKGTYIRSLAETIGEKLGTGATLSELERTKTAGFKIESCVPLELLNEENIENFVFPAETALLNYNILNVSYNQAVRFSNGGELDIKRVKFKNEYSNGEIFRIKFNNDLIALGKVNFERECIKPVCVLIPGYK